MIDDPGYYLLLVLCVLMNIEDLVLFGGLSCQSWQRGHGAVARHNPDARTSANGTASFVIRFSARFSSTSSTCVAMGSIPSTAIIILLCLS